MSKPPRRTFTLLDAMILVAATAIGLAVARYISDAPVALSEVEFGGGRIYAWFRNAMRWLTCIALMWSLFLLPIRLRQPRPTFRRLMRQPSTRACCTIALSIALGGMLGIPLQLQLSPGGRDD